MDYIYIRAWHKMTGSYQYYIDGMVAKARQDSAPENAIYYDDFTHKWMTLDDVASSNTRARVTAFAKRLRTK